MSDANSFQIGGSHYKTSYEHWDLAINCNLGYLDSQSVKYVCRWRKKNGVEDLRKAHHFVVKLIENWNKVFQQRRSSRLVRQELARFHRANSLDPKDNEIICLICLWEVPSELSTAASLIEELIKAHEGPAPATDSNKHAERPQ